MRKSRYEALRKYRTEEGFRLLHSGARESFVNRYCRPADDGICNTITLVSKDYYVVKYEER
jgi:hypothetical protein